VSLAARAKAAADRPKEPARLLPLPVMLAKVSAPR
jgi:hypothetical protein